MKKIIYLFILTTMVSCGSSDNFTLQGNIKGLKKGTVYLMKFQDTLLVTLDSVVVDGDPNFTLHTNLEEPEMLFVKLDKKNNTDNYVEFFASEGVSTLNSTLKNFIYDAEVTGSEQQKLYGEYKNMLSEYENKNLELTEQHLMAQIKKDTAALDSLQGAFDKYLKSKYRYSLNYAATHGGSEVAPYIALAEMPNATIKVLDTLYNSLEPKIKKSKYGKLLKEEITKRKAE